MTKLPCRCNCQYCRALLTEYNLSKPPFAIVGILVRDSGNKISDEKAQAFLAEYGQYQPSFLTISPSKARTCAARCSLMLMPLRQTGWDMVDRIVSVAADLWGRIHGHQRRRAVAYRSQERISRPGQNHPALSYVLYQWNFDHRCVADGRAAWVISPPPFRWKDGASAPLTAARRGV